MIRSALALAMMSFGSTALASWESERGVDPMTDKVSATIETKATEGYKGFLGLTVTPTLTIRCQFDDDGGGYKTWVMIAPINPKADWRSHTASIRYRIDGGKAVTDTWGEGTRGRDKALLITGKKASDFAKKLLGANRLLFAWPEAFTAGETVPFAVDGLAEVLPVVAEPCGWKLPATPKPKMTATPAQTPVPTPSEPPGPTERRDPNCIYSKDGELITCKKDGFK